MLYFLTHSSEQHMETLAISKYAMEKAAQDILETTEQNNFLLRQ